MAYLATFLYVLSLLFQSIVAWFAFITFGRTGKHWWGWLFFSLALLLMLGRRVYQIISIMHGVHANVTDAVLSVPISFLMLLGVLSICKAYGELEEKTERLICAQKVDFLTSAMNRAEFNVIGEKEVERSLRTGRSFGLLMLDLDHFKEVNDRYGHQVGDEVLKSITCICHNTLRKIDIFARYGGEEFMVLLPEATPESACEVAERLRKNVSDHLGFASGLQNKKITISIGVAIFEPNANAIGDRATLFNSLVNQADMAMYSAKNAGRDQVFLFE